jgi:hypothetical protein
MTNGMPFGAAKPGGIPLARAIPKLAGDNFWRAILGRHPVLTRRRAARQGRCGVPLLGDASFELTRPRP